jgi:2-oxoglutarate ferredoxin oxidoreductase subunit alpha
MFRNDMTIKIGGAAGQGVESGGAGFAKALAHGGLHVFGLQDYMSRVRGGHNFYQIRVGERPLYSHTDNVHLLIALAPETLRRHSKEVVPGGGIVYDEGFEVDRTALLEQGILPLPVPMVKIADEAGARIMANTAAFGATAGITRYEFECLAGVIRENFGKRGQGIVDANLKVARTAYDFAREHYAAGFPYRLEPVEAPARMVISGNDTLCLGALLGGCRFVSAYPMTPASSIIEWWAAHASRYGLIAKHAEDEIAAICMAIGVNHAGVRGMTATSGGGFSLMVEGLGLAAMTETPVVVIESQRPGPATGMPTRTAQEDLLFVVHASQGEFPRIVLAPGTIEECFHAGWRAFNLAEQYQCPVIVLLDHHISNSVRSVARGDLRFDAVAIDRGQLLTEKELDQLSAPYKRYGFTESGISPRAVPGHPNAVFVACSDEHDEYGHFEDEDADNRIRMVEKRMRKLSSARKVMRPPLLYGPKRAETTFVGWGSSCGPIWEAVDRLNEDGASVNSLHFVDVWPFPVDEVLPMIEPAERLVVVEDNATGQFARLLCTYTGLQVDDEIHRFDGRPLSPEYILDRLQQGEES